MADTSIPFPQGFVNLDKPGGMTSRRASDRVARCFGREIPSGHAGTLDPMATGVLPVAVGGATRLTELVSGADKEYRARIRLGLATDTDDAQGFPLGGERPVEVSRARVEEVLASFLGEVMQRPPDFSAIKRGGRAAHRLARSGRSPGLSLRPAVYHQLELLRFQPPELEIRALVAKGTYIRALARDLGEQLGCGGHLAGLVRTRAGAFTLERAVKLETLQTLASEGRAAEVLIPVREAFPELLCLTAGEDAARAVRRGQALALSDFSAGVQAPPGLRCLVADESGRVLSLAELVAGEAGALFVQPRKRIR